MRDRDIYSAHSRILSKLKKQGIMKFKYRKKSTKTGKILEGVGNNFSGWPEYIPLMREEVGYKLNVIVTDRIVFTVYLETCVLNNSRKHIISIPTLSSRK